MHKKIQGFFSPKKITDIDNFGTPKEGMIQDIFVHPAKNYPTIPGYGKQATTERRDL
jgi:hypothetical protein